MIATKGGYIPFEGAELKARYLDTGVIEEKEVICGNYCMSPSFLENQIHSSLKNMGLEAIDLYYLQNPESALSFLGEEAFYKQLQEVFILFEKKIQEKKIRRYGIASWDGFRRKESLQLEKILKCAQAAGGEKHHFKAVQFPYNLIMLEALKIKGQLVGSSKKTIFEAANALGISILISSPLMQSKVRMISKRFLEHLPKGASAALQALEFVLSTPQVISAFCGMKRGEHWEENQTALFKPSWQELQWSKACSQLF